MIARAAESEFSKAKREEELGAKINLMLEGLESLSGAIEDTRVMLGDMTAISVVSVLFAERSKKQLEQILRGKKR